PGSSTIHGRNGRRSTSSTTDRKRPPPALAVTRGCTLPPEKNSSVTNRATSTSFIFMKWPGNETSKGLSCRGGYRDRIKFYVRILSCWQWVFWGRKIPF